MKEITFGAFNNPNVWYGPDCGAIHFASEEDAKRAEALFTEMAAEILAPRPEGREQEPVAWAITFNGLFSRNIYFSEAEARTTLDNLNHAHPDGIRRLVPLRAPQQQP
jgi:hypothetical protein